MSRRRDRTNRLVSQYWRRNRNQRSGFSVKKAFSERRFAGAIALSGLVLIAAPPSICFGETLADAIALSYQTNPALQRQRAQQRVLDETYIVARTGFRPTVGVTASAEYQREDFGASGGAASTPAGTFFISQGAGHYETNTGGAQLSVTQPLYTGGRTEAGVRAAEANVVAGRAGLLQVEEIVLQTVIQAYEDVRRDGQIVTIRRDNVSLLASQLQETQTKFQLGDGTRTDVARAAAQLASAQALLSSALAQVQISRANYLAAVGQNPEQLAPEPPLPGLPATVDQAFDAAEATNPSLVQSKMTEVSSLDRLKEARAANRPTISLQGSLGYVGPIEPFVTKDYDRTVTGMVNITQPIFTGGLNSSNIRSALEQNASDRISIEVTRRQIMQGVSQAWNTMSSSHANVASDEEQVRAASVAFEGSREEYRAGLRTNLEVLLAQQNLGDAQVALAQAHHDEYVAQSNLLSAMGRLEARLLVRGLDLYDPVKSFNHVKNANAVPWEGLVETLDAIGSPAPKPVSIGSTIQPSTGVTMISPDQPVRTQPPS